MLIKDKNLYNYLNKTQKQILTKSTPLSEKIRESIQQNRNRSELHSDKRTYEKSTASYGGMTEYITSEIKNGIKMCSLVTSMHNWIF